MSKQVKEFNYNPPLIPFLDVLMRDHNLIALNKPSGLLSVPGRLEKHHDSALSRVSSLCSTAFAVHRLDMDTSGILLCALTPEARRSLGIQFEKRLTRKLYLCEVKGRLEGQGKIAEPMRCDWENRPLQIIDHKQGKAAVTFYRSLKADNRSSVILLMPYTGRSHQLRVHMAFLEHPILGDRFYAHKKTFCEVSNLRLHAAALSLFHPTSDETIKLVSVPDFAKHLIDKKELLDLLDQQNFYGS